MYTGCNVRVSDIFYFCALKVTRPLTAIQIVPYTESNQMFANNGYSRGAPKLFFHPRHNLSKTHDDTPHNFAPRKVGTKLYITTNTTYIYTFALLKCRNSHLNAFWYKINSENFISFVFFNVDVSRTNHFALDNVMINRYWTITDPEANCRGIL